MGRLANLPPAVAGLMNLPAPPQPPPQPPGVPPAPPFEQFILNLQTIDWCGPGATVRAAAVAAALPPAGPNPVTSLMGWRKLPTGKWTIPPWFAAGWSGTPGPIGQAICSALRWCFSIADIMCAVRLRFAGCAAEKMIPIAIARSGYGFLERYVGAHMPQMTRALDYTCNYLCPTITVTAGEAVTAYYHGQMQDTECVSWGKANGVCEYAQRLQMQTVVYHHPPSDMVRKLWYGMTPDEGALCDDLRWWGVIDPITCGEIVTLQRPLWGVGEIYDALHRLRPGRVPRNREYLTADARTDLTKLGYTSQQVEQMLLLAETPLDMRHALQPYYYSELGEQQVVQTLLDHGFSQATIQALLPFLRIEKTRRGQELIGAAGAGSIASRYAKGELPGSTASALLEQWGLSGQQVEDALTLATVERTEDERAEGIGFVRSRVISGEIGMGEARVELGAFQVDPGAVAYLTGVWSLELATTRRPGSASDFCTWAKQGLMSAQEYETRLLAQGYSAVDVARIMRMCSLVQEQKQQKTDAANAAKRETYLRQQRAKAAALDDARRKHEMAVQVKIAQSSDKEKLAEHKADLAAQTAQEKRMASLAKARLALEAKQAAKKAAKAPAATHTAATPATHTAATPHTTQPLSPQEALQRAKNAATLSAAKKLLVQEQGTAPAVSTDTTAVPAPLGAEGASADTDSTIGPTSDQTV